MPTGSHFYVMTLEKPLHPTGTATFTYSGTTTPPTGATRAHMFGALYDQGVRRHPELDGASVLFFSLEPNTL